MSHCLNNSSSEEDSEVVENYEEDIDDENMDEEMKDKNTEEDIEDQKDKF